VPTLTAVDNRVRQTAWTRWRGYGEQDFTMDKVTEDQGLTFRGHMGDMQPATLEEVLAESVVMKLVSRSA
jgi:hypothetical protein